LVSVYIIGGVEWK